MLRLGVGWSAERLSQEYEAGGAGELTRTTIAKIERDIRHIKAGEVDGVARVFGLTADDLLDLEGPKVFLSYAEQDAGIGQEVAAWLDDHGFQPLSPGLPAADDQEPSSAGAPLIDVAQAFVALLSPNFLTSPRCRRELDLALRRERQLLAADLATHFVYVLQVTAKPELDDSGLSAHSPIVLPAASGRSRDVALNKLGGSILSGSRALDVRADPAIRVPASAEFLDRGEELERVLYALNNSSGASFWLVISPPGIGKSWLLRQLKNKAAEPASGGWMTSIVDLRPDEPAEPDGPAEAARNRSPPSPRTTSGEPPRRSSATASRACACWTAPNCSRRAPSGSCGSISVRSTASFRIRVARTLASRSWPPAGATKAGEG